MHFTVFWNSIFSWIHLLREESFFVICVFVFTNIRDKSYISHPFMIFTQFFFCGNDRLMDCIHIILSNQIQTQIGAFNKYISKSVTVNKHCCYKKLELSFASTSSGAVVYVALYLVYRKYHQHND